MLVCMLVFSYLFCLLDRIKVYSYCKFFEDERHVELYIKMVLSKSIQSDAQAETSRFLYDLDM